MIFSYLPQRKWRCFFAILLLFAGITTPSHGSSCTTLESEQSKSIRIPSGTLEEAISKIRDALHVSVVFNTQDVLGITVAGGDYPADNVENLLQQLIHDTPLTLKKSGSSFLLLRTRQQTGIIKGRVVDKFGNPLQGANIRFAGSNKVFVTDADGYYTGATPAGTYAVSAFHLSFAGSVESEVNVSPGQTVTVNFVLEDSETELAEVVVVGYGTQSRKLVSSSVATVKQDNFNRGGFSNPAQLLQGKVAGLTITRSGDPNETPSISLRGPSTLREGAAQEPFYVIDGIPGADFRLVAPDDIESIDLLKDASATAIYGTRAANGVIMITTKSNRSGSSNVSYSGYTGIEQAARTIRMMNSEERGAYLDKMGRSARPADEQGSHTDWFDEISRSGITQNHNLSLSGGAQNTTYNGSVSFFENKGILTGSAMNRMIGRMNVSHATLNDRLKLDFSLSNSRNNADLIPNQNLVLYNALRYIPTVPVKQANGSFSEDLNRMQYYNPVALQEKGFEELKTNITLINLSTQLKLPYGLMYNISLSNQRENRNSGSYYDRDYALKIGLGGEAFRSSYESTKNMLESYFTFDKKIDAHKLNLVAGYSWQQDVTGDGFQASNRNFPTDDLGYSNIGLGSPAGNFRPDWGTNQYQKLRLISFYGRVNYDYKQKYLFQLSVRRDGSSAFGENHRWGTFPAGSLAWRITEEGFMDDQSFFDELKFRIGYGVTGNSLGFNPLISKIRFGDAGTYYHQGNFVTAIFARQNANPDLRWEKTAMTNLGMEASMLNNRLNVTLDVYDKKTSDLIWEYNVSTTQYFVNTFTANVGDISNKGVELLINATPVSSGKFKWQTDLNIAHNKNTLESLSNEYFQSDSIRQGFPYGQGQSNVSVQLLKAGYPVGQFFTFKYAGKSETGVSQFYDRNGNITEQPVDQQDYFYAGNAQPKVLVGWGNTFNWGKWDLNIFVRGSFGGRAFNATLADLNRPNEVENYNLPRFSNNESPEDGNAYRYSSRFIENASFVRLDNATLGYAFGNIGKIKSIRVYLTGNNLFIITPYQGIDPEINLGGLTPGLDNKNYYPRTRSFLFGLNMSF